MPVFNYPEWLAYIFSHWWAFALCFAFFAGLISFWVGYKLGATLIGAIIWIFFMTICGLVFIGGYAGAIVTFVSCAIGLATAFIHFNHAHSAPPTIPEQNENKG